MKHVMFASMLVFASAAHAEEMTADGSLSAGAAIGRVKWDGPAVDGSGDLRMSETLSSELISLRGFYGPKLSGAVAIGLRLDATFFLGRASFPYTTIEGGLELAGGPEVVVRPAGSKLVARAAAGMGWTSFAASVSDVYAPDNVGFKDTLRGPVARALVGWSLSSHFDLAVEARAAYFLADHVTYAPIALLVGVHATDW